MPERWEFTSLCCLAGSCDICVGDEVTMVLGQVVHAYCDHACHITDQGTGVPSQQDQPAPADPSVP